MSSSDKTKEVLEQLLSALYAEQGKSHHSHGGSYLMAQDGQLLGKINNNLMDSESILNKYGPFGSHYSPTSIFNQYSQYGSQYGAFSIHNPYCSTPPQLFINGRLVGFVSANRFVSNRISPEAFLYSLENQLPLLMQGRIVESEEHARILNKESFIVAADGTFLGKLSPNRFDSESIFNAFGPYGNKFSSNSLFNKFSTYGNQFNELSPYNKFSKKPPKLIVKGELVAYLTANNSIRPRVDPEELMAWAERNVR